MGHGIKQIGLLRWKFYTCTETIKAVAKEILMRISNEDELHTSEARGQFPEGFAGQTGQSYTGQAIVEGWLQPGCGCCREHTGQSSWELVALFVPCWW